MTAIRDTNIRDVNINRLCKYKGIISDEAFVHIYDYSMGNSRDAIWISREIIVHLCDKRALSDVINGITALSAIRDVIKKKFKDCLTMSQWKRKLLIYAKMVSAEKS